MLFRSPTPWALGLALVLAINVGACGQSETSNPAPGESAAAANGGVGEAGDGGAGAAVPTRVGDLELEVVPYQVPEFLDAAGGVELGAMLDTLDLDTSEVSLVIAVDPAGTLAIGLWQLPDRGASAILSAWEGAAGSAWRSDTLAGEAALSGRGPDGSTAWAVARDDVFLYVATDDRSLAEAAVDAIP